ncbi:MAG: IS1380 family transposase [Acidobacteriota bacterium]|nr:IS1380 family transposase [Acidobacteriota bacterium]
MSFEFEGLFSRKVVAGFNGGQISSEGGSLLLREVERRTGIIRGFAGCFTDHRAADRIEHSVRELVAQRVYALALGYEDLNDHDQLRADPLLAVLADKRDPEGRGRKQKRDRGKALAGKSTLNRWELTRADATGRERYAKIVMDTDAIDRLLVEVFLEAHATAPEEIVLDLDATDDPLYGRQEGRFFHGYYGHYCYLPLYIFAGEHLLCARLRSSNIDTSADSREEVERIVNQIRDRWPAVRIILRADSGFCRDALMNWCETNHVDYVFGLARNQRLRQIIDAQMTAACLLQEQTQQAARVFTELVYETRDSWTCSRRVIAKAEYLAKGENPRFVVTSLDAAHLPAQPLYEQLYCARGEMENRIKEQFSLFSDRTSTAYLRSNQLRLYLSSIAYLLLEGLRRLGLQGTAMARAQCQTIRLKLLKIGALVRVTVRKVWLSLSSGYPHQALFARIFQQLHC